MGVKGCPANVGKIDNFPHGNIAEILQNFFKILRMKIHKQSKLVYIIIKRSGRGYFMKFISWNVNGLRACLGKGFLDFFAEADADVVCLQETKMQEGQAELELPDKLFGDGKIHCVYAGTLDPRKGSVMAAEAARFLKLPPLQQMSCKASPSSCCAAARILMKSTPFASG